MRRRVRGCRGARKSAPKALGPESRGRPASPRPSQAPSRRPPPRPSRPPCGAPPTRRLRRRSRAFGAAPAPARGIVRGEELVQPTPGALRTETASLRASDGLDRTPTCRGASRESGPPWAAPSSAAAALGSVSCRGVGVRAGEAERVCVRSPTSCCSRGGRPPHRAEVEVYLRLEVGRAQARAAPHLQLLAETQQDLRQAHVARRAVSRQPWS